MPLVLLGDQPLTTAAWTDRETHTQTSLLYIYRYNTAFSSNIIKEMGGYIIY